MKQYTFDDKYEAILRKDPEFEGIFVTAVKTTGIFCRPGCSARKPKKNNVEFFDTAQDALRHGYRPCLVCKPMDPGEETPAYIKELITTLQTNPFERIRDHDLRIRGLEPHTIRRWFKKHHNVSFHGFQRLLRINNAFQKLSQGTTVTSAAFDSGYQSLSGFGERFRQVFGNIPSQSKGKTVIHITRLTTPLGPMFCCATDEGVCLLEFTDRRMLEREFKDLCKRLNAVILPGQSELFTDTQKQLDEYFTGQRTTFDIRLHPQGTDFHQRVWTELQRIPYGTTLSYKKLAALMGIPNAVRAAANANGMNKIAIIIPCHRVIGENGMLTGYAGGLPRKQYLLELERNTATKEKLGS